MQGATRDSTITLRGMNRATLARQMLLAREKTKVALAVERVAGLQAQWPAPPFVGLWSRIAGFGRQDLIRALDRREVVRAPLMRGTIHVVSARDYVDLRGPIGPMLARGMAAVLRTRAVGLDVPGLVREARAFLEERPRTFGEVRDHLTSLHPEGDERARGFAVRMHLPVVMVPTDDRWGFPADADFAVAESWLGKPPGASEDPTRLVLRYLAAFGPGSAADVQTWSGLQGIAKVMAALRPQLRVLKDERGREVFDVADAPLPPDDTPAPARFLPAFDNLVLAHADRKRFVADAHRKRVYLPGLRVSPTFLVDGFVAGTWGVARKKAVATLTIAPFAVLARKARDELAKEAEALVRFVEEDAATFELKFAKA